MAIYRIQRTYSKKEKLSRFEEEGAREIMRDYENAGKSAHLGAAIGGGIVGGYSGALLGAIKPKYGVVGSLVGATAAGYAGHRWGKKYKKKQIEEGKRKVDIYKNSSPSERAEMRRQRLEEAKIRQMQAQAAAQQQMAWNSWR